jgi:hypothetical protein
MVHYKNRILVNEIQKGKMAVNISDIAGHRTILTLL